MQLFPAIEYEVEQYLRGWISEATATGEQYVYQYPFRTLATQLPLLVTQLWLDAWSQPFPMLQSLLSRAMRETHRTGRTHCARDV
jgi:hypothetical protein